MPSPSALWSCSLAALLTWAAGAPGASNPLRPPYTYVYDPGGNRIRTVQFAGAGAIAPQHLFFGPPGRLLVTPGGYAFGVP